MKSLIIKIVAAVVGLFILGALSIVLAFNYFHLDLPKIDKLQDYKPRLASQILSKDGVILAELGSEKREIVEIEDVPARIIDAFLSAEDDKFFEHKGVDYFGLARAMFANFKAGKVVQGGSTITQQVAKSFLLSKERSIVRKVKDFILAQRIEEKLTKKEILYLYLNQVYLGGGYYGIKAAARGYFNKDLKDITIAEAAMLAGLLVAPAKYSPFINSRAAKKRQGYVLERMRKLNKISEAQYQQAVNEETIYQIHEEDLKAGYFVEWVRQKIVEVVGEKSLYEDGFKIKTTLDWNLQKVAEDKVRQGIKEIDRRQGYKGPFAHIEKEEFSRFELESRKEIYKKASSYFKINQAHDKIYQYHLDENAFAVINAELAQLKINASDEQFVPGLSASDDVVKVLKENEQYEAIVKRVDDLLGIIYVSVAGSPGIIPLDHFRWAHKRSISENTAYYQEVTKPSSILRVGDLVHVQMLKPSVQLSGYLTKEGASSLAKSKSSALFKSQKYVLCRLDQVPEVQGAVFSIESETGNVLSYVGGSDYATSKFNRVAQAKRQPGSSFKPILFASALERGYTPTTIIMDTPEAMPGFDSASSWKPKNYDGEYRGPVTMRVTLEESRNIPTIKIADKVGVSNVLKFLDRIGFNSKLENNLSIALGSFGISPRDLVTSFAIFSNGGKYVMPKAIVSVVDRDGKKYTVNELDPDMRVPENVVKGEISDPVGGDSNEFTRNLMGSQVLDARVAYVLTSMLKGVITHGTATAARELGPNVAGKTGTTSDYVDAWFVGYSPHVVTGVWVGFDDNRTMGYGETGGRAPLAIWKDFMRAAISKYGDDSFPVPNGIKQFWVNRLTGKDAPANSLGAIFESSFDGVTQEIATEPDSTGKPQPSKQRPLGDDEYFENQ